MIALADRTLEATFLPEAGMLGATLRHRGEDLLSPLGIPLLHPWANRLSRPHYLAAGRRGRVPDAAFVPRDAHGLPIHGLSEPAGAWQVLAADAGTLCARLEHPVDAARAAAFPYRHRLDVDARLTGPTLRVRTTLTATGDIGVPVAFGYHPYLRLPGVPRRAWQGSLGAQAWDDAYEDVRDGSRFGLEGGGRRIIVAFEEGWGVAQLFAPHFADVVCFEPMTAPVDALVSGGGLRVVPPGGRHRATFSITVEDR